MPTLGFVWKAHDTEGLVSDINSGSSFVNGIYESMPKSAMVLIPPDEYIT